MLFALSIYHSIILYLAFYKVSNGNIHWRARCYRTACRLHSPYIARLMETALLEVDRGVIEAYQAMGVSTIKIIWHVMVKEARPSLVLGLTIATIGLIGATAMAGL